VYRAVADSLAGFRRTDARRAPLSVPAAPARLRAVA